MNRFTRHKKLTALAIIAVLGVAGGAYAYWTSTGEGGGTAVVGTSGTVSVTATVTPGVVPGGNTLVTFTAGNDTDTNLYVGTVHLAGITVDTAHATCVVTDFTMADVIENHQIDANTPAEPLPTNGSLAYANTNVSQDGCKGATLTLALTNT